MLPLAAIVLAVLVAPAVVGANPSHRSDALRARAEALAAKSHAAALDLYSLDQRLAQARTHLGALERQQASLRSQRASLRHQIAVARRGTRIAQVRIAERLRTLFEQGNVSSLEILFGSKSLDDALTALDNLDRTTLQDEEVLRQFEAAHARLASASAALARRESALAAATAGARATAVSLEQTRAQRSAYIQSLASQRRMTQRQIVDVVAAAHAAQLRTQQLARVTTADATARVAAAPAATISAPPAGAATPFAGARTLTVVATGYSLGGATATGLAVGWGVAAVDPSVIPLGTHMSVPGYGDAVAADTGGAVVGTTIDLWFPTVAQANAWGRRTVTVVLR
jgi:3D (Asp-Asp-Asp) domain-containing protein